MKTQRFLRSLTNLLRRWRRRYRALCRRNRLFRLVSSPRTVLKNLLLYLSITGKKGEYNQPRNTSRPKTKLVKTKNSIYTVILCWMHERRSYVILILAIVSLTGVMGHDLYNQPQLRAGTLAPQTFIAPYTDNIEDKKQTEEQRKAVSKKSTPILMVDTQINEKIDQKLRLLLDSAQEIRTIAGSFPFFDTLVLSISTQRYLRSCDDSEWQAILLAVDNSKKQKLGFLAQQWRRGINVNSDSKNTGTVPRELSSPDIKAINLSQKSDFSHALAELEAYRITTSEKSLSSLINQILQVRKRYIQATTRLSQMESVRAKKVYETSLLDLSDEEWSKTRTGIHQSAERILTQGIPEGLPPSILNDAVSLQVQTLVPRDAERLAIKVLSTVLDEPNLKLDEETTKRYAQKAADGVPAKIVKVGKGEVIVSKGKEITEWNFVVLEHYHLIRREVHWLGLVELGGIVTSAVMLFVWVERQIRYQLRQRDRLLILLLTLSTPAVLAMGIPYTTWSAVGLLLGSFYGPILGVTVMGLLLLTLPISLEVSRIWVLSGAVGGILGSCMAQRLRSREELALLGVAIALTQGGVYLLLKILIGAAFGSAGYAVLQEAVLYTFSGLAWSIIALGLSPYLEKFFDLITPIRLAELANPNRPLLKRLATETPGTFQHTLFVATLAEAAAKELGCNVELVRAGALYHDIGKMHDPLGFIENQMGGPNKHDTEIKDPWKSVEIIKKHVSEGLVMARKHSLPRAIQAFIPEHQGTMLVAYFYHQAQQMAKENPELHVDEVDFRYPGPIPQSRETGIVMLADSCEAALRSLKDTTGEQALTMLNNILRARWQDGQLANSRLTREEMSLIAQIFVDVWQQFHHKRIVYPKLTSSHR